MADENQTENTTTTSQKTPEGEVVPRTTYEEIKAENARIAKQLKEIQDAAEADKLDKLTKGKQYKELADTYERENKELKEKYTKLTQSVVESKKFDSVKDAAVKMGLRPEVVSDLELVDMDGVIVETTSTGKINIIGADRFAERLKAAKPHWFTEGAPNLNTKNPKLRIEGSGSDVTGAMVADAQRKAMRSGKSEDHAEYKKLASQYFEQKKTGKAS